jgi:hypothetical protein
MSYDPSTNAGKVRMLIGDTTITDHIFTDAEVTTLLTMAEQNVYLAAALAFGTIVRTRALLAKKIKREGYESEEHALTELRQMVKDLQEQAITIGGLQTVELGLTDEHFESFRPGWRNLNDEVIE